MILPDFLVVVLSTAVGGHVMLMLAVPVASVFAVYILPFKVNVTRVFSAMLFIDVLRVIFFPAVPLMLYMVISGAESVLSLAVNSSALCSVSSMSESSVRLTSSVA